MSLQEPAATRHRTTALIRGAAGRVARPLERASVADLFEQYEALVDACAPDDEKHALAQRICALLAAGERSAAVDAGVRWLVENQRPDGNWDEDQFTGTGFPGDFYINYHLYRLVFPISALGRYLEGVT